MGDFSIQIKYLHAETIEESSYSKSEMDRLLDEVEKLRDENTNLRSELSHSSQVRNIFHAIFQKRKSYLPIHFFPFA